MLHQRRQGLATLLGSLHLFLVPLWFVLFSGVAVQLLGLMSFSQVAYEVYLLGLFLGGLLNMQDRALPIEEGPVRRNWTLAFKQGNREMVVLFVVLVGLIWATKDKAISRQFVGGFLITSWGWLILSNRFLPGLLAARFFSGHDRIRTVLVGSPPRAMKLQQWAASRHRVGIEVCGLIVFDQTEERNDASGFHILGTIDDLEAILAREEIKQIVLLENRQSATWVQYVVDASYAHGCRLLVLSPWDELFNQTLSAVQEGDIHFFTLREEPLQNPFNRLLKRLLDIVVSLPVCLIVLPLLTLLVWVMQAIQAPGSLFFHQERGGAEGRRFRILKFRTMQERPPGDEATQATPGDSRIYPFGRFLRRSSLDEVPQFLNVLTGSMSVVGPRPHLLAHDDEFAQLVQRYRSRHHVKPGITGMAQHLGYRGEIVSQEDIDGRIRLDLEYIQTWSLWLDLGIIVKTGWQILFPPKSAY